MRKVLIVGKPELREIEGLSLPDFNFFYAPQITDEILKEKFDLVITDSSENLEKIKGAGILFLLDSPEEIKKIKEKNIYSSCKGFILKDEKKQYMKILPELIQHIVKDISVKEKLKEEEEFISEFEEFLEESLAAVYIYDEDFNFLYINPTFCEIIGYKKEEIIGKIKALDIVFEEDREKFIELARKRFSGEIPYAQFYLRLKTKDGKIKHCVTVGRAGRYKGKKVIMGTIMDISEKLIYQQQLERTLEQTIYAITKIIDLKDPYTAGHQRKVALLSEAIAKELGFPEEKLREILWAGLLHDVGKIVIPSEILVLPRKLTPIEFDIVKTHTIAGHNILKEIELFENIARIVLQHHERLDGTGYPHGLKGSSIIKEARIIAVSDVVDAMSSYRPYREAYSIEEALVEILLYKGKKYDPEVVDVCVYLFREKGFKFD